MTGTVLQTGHSKGDLSFTILDPSTRAHEFGISYLNYTRTPMSHGEGS